MRRGMARSTPRAQSGYGLVSAARHESSADPNCYASASSNSVTLSVKANTGALITVGASDGNGSTQMWHMPVGPFWIEVAHMVSAGAAQASEPAAAFKWARTPAPGLGKPPALRRQRDTAHVCANGGQETNLRRGTFSAGALRVTTRHSARPVTL